MNNQDQAAEVIGDLFADAFLNYKGIGRDIARSLHEAGLLAPDLPTPTKIDDDEYRWDKTHSCLAYDYQTGVENKIKVPGGVTAFQDENAEVWLDVDHGIHTLTPDDARSLGLALLAAVNYMEEQ